MGAETQRCSQDRKAPRALWTRQCLVNGLRSVPSWGTLTPGPRGSFWAVQTKLCPGVITPSQSWYKPVTKTE